MKVKKDEFLIDGGKSAMMTIDDGLSDRSRLELRHRRGFIGVTCCNCFVVGFVQSLHLFVCTG